MGQPQRRTMKPRTPTISRMLPHGLREGVLVAAGPGRTVDAVGAPVVDVLPDGRLRRLLLDPDDSVDKATVAVGGRLIDE
jgi:hypothetical protein